MPVAHAVFNYLDPTCNIEVLLDDGADISPGQEAFYVEGPIRTLLGGERLVLNTMQRLSGIANISRVFAKAVAGTNARILDTRKTTPQLRFLEKYAVAVGGSDNYRIGLYDWIMIKDNHVDGAGGMRQAITGVHNYLKENDLKLDITVEVRNLSELETVLSIGNVRRIMLDNFALDDLKTAVKTIGDRFESEASGGVNLNTVRSIAETGVDYISVGALTHSAQSIDLSLKMM
jgi:nicotinate-nucleotide pyrophosphorylase (carboxylating)